MSKIIASLFLTLAMFFNPMIQANAAATIEEAKAMVEDGIKYVAEVGQEKAFAAFNDREKMPNRWNKAELYLFAYKFDGTNVVLPINTGMIGKNFLERQSPDGSFYLQNMVKTTSNAPGEGYVEYSWKNPEKDAIQPKISFVKRIPGTDMFLGSGVYK